MSITLIRTGVATRAVAAEPGGGRHCRADATERLPDPQRILRTPCTAEQIMAAARDVEPVYYERYMIDYNNKSRRGISRGAQDRIHWFFSMDYAGRRQYSENTATNAFFENMAHGAGPTGPSCSSTTRASRPTPPTVCKNYPPNDMSVVGLAPVRGFPRAIRNH